MADLLRAIFNYTLSVKEKVVTNALRALGFLFSDLDFDFLIDEVVPYMNERVLNLMDRKLKPSGAFSLERAIQIGLIDHLDNKSPKITWNACIAIGKIL